MTLFDVNAWTGMWPFTAVRQTGLDDLVSQLRAVGVSGAMVSPLNAVLGPDPMLANVDLLAEMSAANVGDFQLRVAPVVDPSLPGWERDLADLVTHDIVAAVRMVPNYHGYDVDGPVALDFVRAATAAGLPVVVQLRVLDERAHHPLMKVPAVPVTAVAALAAAVPTATLVLAGVFQAELAAIAGLPNVLAELSSVESGDALGNAIAALGSDRLLLGTHAPVYEPAVAIAKVLRGGVSEDVQWAIGGGNAAKVFRTDVRRSGSAL